MTQTPKGNASILIRKYAVWSADDNEGKYLYSAKQCALIAVDEILESGVDADYYFNKSVGYMITYQEYYQEVKQEIEKYDGKNI